MLLDDVRQIKNPIINCKVSVPLHSIKAIKNFLRENMPDSVSSQ